MHELRHSIRTVCRDPGFTVAVVLTLAIAIGANSLIFCVVRATLLRSLPFRDPDRLVALWEHHPMLGKQEITPPDFRDWRDQNQSFEQMAAYTDASYFEPIVSGGTVAPERIGVTLASGNLLSVLGIRPALGRGFLESEDQGGHNGVAMLSERLWRRRYNADPAVVGQVIDLNGEPYTIIGVLPFQIRVPDWADVWLPMSRLDPATQTRRAWHVLTGIGRLKPGVSLERATVDIRTIVERLRRDFPMTNGPTTFEMRPLQRELTGDVRGPLIALSAGVGLLLLLAAANVANLLLTRNARRQREIATRRALGASGFDLVRQFVLESWLLSIAGSIGGLMLAMLGGSLIRQLAAGVVPHPENISLDSQAVAFALLLSIFTTGISVLAPCAEFLGSPQGLTLNLRMGTATRSQRRWQILFMTSQIGIAVAVLVGAGLLVRSFRFLSESDPGFQIERLLTFRISLSPMDYGTEAANRSYYDRLLPRLRSLSGVSTVALVNTPPLSAPTRAAGRFFVDAVPEPGPGQFPVAQIRQVSPDYFRTMGIPLQQGRYLQDSDEDTMNVVVNGALARQFFKGRNPLGQNIVMGLLGPRRFNRPIVGVVADTKDTGLQNEIQPTFYFVARPAEATILIRSTTVPESLIPAVRGTVLAVDPKQGMDETRTMQELVTSSLRQQRFAMLVFSFLSTVALSLAAIGIYGVVANQTERRIPELGIRIALGAVPRDVYREVIAAGSSAVFVGIAGGICFALVLTRLMRGMVVGIQLVDSPSYFAAAAVMVIVALAAMAIPARRATKIHPAVALRSGE